MSNKVEGDCFARFRTLARNDTFKKRIERQVEMPGKKGNTNALKHGFYSSRFTQEENKAFETARQNPLDEIVYLLFQAAHMLALQSCNGDQP